MGTTESLEQQEGEPQCDIQKNSKANTKVYDFNQKTMQALDGLAGCTPHLRKRGQTWKMRTLRATCSMPMRVGRWTSLQKSATPGPLPRFSERLP